MHTSRRVPHSTVSRFRGLCLVGVLLQGTGLGAFAAQADLALVATAAPAPVVVDRELRFFLHLVNQGPDNAEDVTVAIDLPAEVSLIAALPSQGVCLPGPPLICQLGPVGAHHPDDRVDITIETVTNVVSGISLAARSGSVTPDPSPDNNSATAWLSVVPLRDSSDLRLDPRSLPAVAFSGVPSEFEIAVANDGPALAGVVDVRVGIRELRLGSFVSASSSQGLCSTALDRCAGFQCAALLSEVLAVSCDLGGVAAGGTASVWLTASVDVPAQTQLTVSADVGAGDTADPDPSNNAVAVAVPVIEMPGGGVVVPVELLGDGPVGPGCFIQAVWW